MALVPLVVMPPTMKSNLREEGQDESKWDRETHGDWNSLGCPKGRSLDKDARVTITSKKTLSERNVEVRWRRKGDSYRVSYKTTYFCDNAQTRMIFLNSQWFQLEKDMLAFGKQHLLGSEGKQIISRRLFWKDAMRTRGLSHWIQCSISSVWTSRTNHESSHSFFPWAMVGKQDPFLLSNLLDGLFRILSLSPFSSFSLPLILTAFNHWCLLYIWHHLGINIHYLSYFSKQPYDLCSTGIIFGEGNGNPLQYSCLENPGDSGAWWAAVYGVAQNRTQLKQLSSSSSSIIFL